MSGEATAVAETEVLDALPCGLQTSDPPSWLEWYLYAAGLSLVPRSFHAWCGLSAIAACVADRVWYEKFKGERLTANLYVMLIGPSGVGKNQAIRRAQKRVESIPAVDRVQPYRGKITAEQLLSRLGDRKKKYGNFVWLVTPELAMEVGSGPKAESFVTHMTELFDSDTTVQDSTRTSGHFTLERPTINWTSGSTQEWLLRSVGKQDILGGFFARIFPIPGERSPWRLPKPIFPADYDSVNDWLTQYLNSLTWVEGEMVMDDYAEELHAWWIETRPEPTDEMLWHFYTHGDNLLIKLAMNLALADGFKLVIEYHHMQGAIALYEWVLSHLGRVLEFAHYNPEVERLELLADVIRRAAGEWVYHSAALRHVSNRGVTKDSFDALLRTLVERGEVQIGSGPGGKVYRWLT